MAWHVDGMTYEAYMGLTLHERTILHDEISELIRRSDPLTDPPRHGRR